MVGTEPSWDLYRSFLAVLRTGSLSAAARLLSTTQPTIGRHIELLEQKLGVSLFTRSPNGLKPSLVAQELRPHAEAMEASVATLLRASSGNTDEDAGTVRIAASHVVGGEILPAMLAEFHHAHPRIDLELSLSNEPDDLLRGDADIAVRMFRPTQEALVAKRIGAVAIRLYAHRHYVERYSLPDTTKAMESHTLIGYDRDPVWIRAAAGMGIQTERERFSFRSDSELAQLSALRAGFGIGACQAGIARRDPDLVPVLPDQICFNLDMWLAMHKDLRSSRCVTLLFEHLALALTGYLEVGGNQES